MKNYLIDKNLFNFVTNYKIINDTILLYFAGEEFPKNIPYSIENEKKILKQMRIQAIEGKYFIKAVKEKRKEIKKYIKSIFRAIAFCLFFIIFYMFNLDYISNLETTIKIIDVDIIFALGVSSIPISLIVQFFNFRRLNKYNEVLDDIKKNVLFVDNEEKINDNLSNPRILDNTSFETIELIDNIRNMQNCLTINNIEKLKYEQLKIILKNIKREETFNFNYELPDDESITLLRKLDD